jgi:hypothetical protein
MNNKKPSFYDKFVKRNIQLPEPDFLYKGEYKTCTGLNILFRH